MNPGRCDLVFEDKYHVCAVIQEVTKDLYGHRVLLSFRTYSEADSRFLTYEAHSSFSGTFALRWQILFAIS
jgi:hypothetical protein